MSFILDALKKSEQNNQRQALPGLQTQHKNNFETEKKPIPWIWLFLVVLFINGAFLLTFSIYSKQKDDTAPRQISNVKSLETPVPATTPDKEPLNNSDESVIPELNPSVALEPLPDKKPIEIDEDISLTPSKMEQTAFIEEKTETIDKVRVASVDIYSDSATEQPVTVALESGIDIDSEEMLIENSADSDLLQVGDIPPMEIDDFPEQTAKFEEENEVDQLIPEFDKLPSIVRKKIPEISISFHAYSHKRSSRIVSINGRIMREGQEITSELKLDKITTDGVIFNYKGDRFIMRVF